MGTGERQRILSHTILTNSSHLEKGRGLFPEREGKDIKHEEVFMSSGPMEKQQSSSPAGVRGGGVSRGSNRMVLWGPFQWLMVFEEAHAAELPRWEPRPGLPGSAAERG